MKKIMMMLLAMAVVLAICFPVLADEDGFSIKDGVINYPLMSEQTKEENFSLGDYKWKIYYGTAFENKGKLHNVTGIQEIDAEIKGECLVGQLPEKRANYNRIRVWAGNEDCSQYLWINFQDPAIRVNNNDDVAYELSMSRGEITTVPESSSLWP